MTRYLAGTRTAVLADLASFGFVLDNPQPMDIVQHEQDACIYLEHIPAQYSYDPITEESVLIKPASTDFCANVTACEGHTFAKEIAEPAEPYNKFAE